MVYALCAPRTLCIRFILCVRLKHSTKLFNISSMITDNNLNYSSWAIVSPRSFLVLSCTIFSFLNNTSLKIKRISEQWCVLFTQPLQLDHSERTILCVGCTYAINSWRNQLMLPGHVACVFILRTNISFTLTCINSNSFVCGSPVPKN